MESPRVLDSRALGQSSILRHPPVVRAIPAVPPYIIISSPPPACESCIHPSPLVPCLRTRKIPQSAAKLLENQKQQQQPKQPMPGEETVKEKESQKNGAADAKSKSGKAGKHPTGVDDTIDDPPPNGSRTPSEQDELEYVPDGGKDAWVVVLGSSLALFASAGMINAYGTFQNYYETTLLPSTSSSIISLIGSVQVFFLYFLGTFTGRAFDAYGTKVLIPAGSFICVFSLMMVSLCQKDQVYQVFLSQGVLFGIGIALLFNPSIAVLGHWFRRRRSLAIGLTTGGSATGGVVFPILLEQLIPKVGFGWAVRIGAFILLACLIVSCLTIRTRLPLTGRLSFRTAIDVGGFRDPRYTLAAVGSFLLFYGFFIPYFYIQIYANYRGVSPQISKYLLAILNAMNVPSRILPGYVADNVGVMNVFVPAAVICCALILGLWLPSRNAGEIISFAALYGLFSGAFVSLVPSYIATISPREKYGARLGSVYMVIAVAVLVGTPTGGALLKETDEAHFRTLIVFCGVMTVAGTVVLAMAGAAGHPAVRRFLKRRSDDESTTDGEKTPVDVEAGGGEGH